MNTMEVLNNLRMFDRLSDMEKEKVVDYVTMLVQARYKLEKTQISDYTYLSKDAEDYYYIEHIEIDYSLIIRKREDGIQESNDELTITFFNKYEKDGIRHSTHDEASGFNNIKQIYDEIESHFTWIPSCYVTSEEFDNLDALANELAQALIQDLITA